jgi:hypothetical protein
MQHVVLAVLFCTCYLQVDIINEKFAEAREEIEYAREDAETVSKDLDGDGGAGGVGSGGGE